MLSMPRVTTNDDPSRAFSMSSPLATPTTAPVASMAAITAMPLCVVDCASLAPTTVASATTAPAERSMAPVRMISSWPVARIATTLDAWSRFVMLSVVKKYGERIDSSSQSAARISSGPSASARSARPVP